MRNFKCSLNHIRFYKRILRKFIPLLTTSVLLANSYLPYFAYGLKPTIAHADAPPALSVTFDTSTDDLKLSVNTASKVEYAVSYTRTSDTGYQIEGVQGSGADASGTYSKSIYMGTCSTTECVRHDVKRTIVKVRVQDLFWTYENKFIFEANGDLSLVEEGKIESLDLTEKDKLWLEDVNTPQPSLTPTPTYTPPTSTPTYLPTPTEALSTPSVQSTVSVTKAPTPTPTIVTPEPQETLSVVIEKSKTKAEPSFVESALSTLFPFSFTAA
jgi:hypothetical protein